MIFPSRRFLKFLLIILQVITIFRCSNHTDQIRVDPARYEAAIRNFEQADSLNFPPQHAVLFTGSSSLRGWTDLAEDFPEYTVINRGFGGSHQSDLNHFMNRIVLPYHPAAVVVYEGDNDIAAGKTPQTVLNDFKSFTRTFFSSQPDTPVLFISIKPSIARINFMEAMARANLLIQQYTESDDRLYYIDVFSLMLDSDGHPRADLFIEDGLHMNKTGYELWTREIKKTLTPVLQELDMNK